MFNIKKINGRLVTTTSKAAVKSSTLPTKIAPPAAKLLQSIKDSFWKLMEGNYDEAKPAPAIEDAGKEKREKDLTPGMPIDDTDKVSPSPKAKGGYDQNDKSAKGKYDGNYSVVDNQFYRIMDETTPYVAVRTKDGNAYVKRVTAGNHHFTKLCQLGTHEPISKNEFEHILNDTPGYYKLQFTYQMRLCRSCSEDPQNNSGNTIPVWPKK